MSIISLLQGGSEEATILDYDFQKAGLPGTWEIRQVFAELKNGFRAFIQLSISLNSTN